MPQNDAQVNLICAKCKEDPPSRLLGYNTLMQIFAHQLVGLPVLGIHIGSQIAITTGFIIDPADLTIRAFLCEGEGRHTLLLLPQDIRQSGPQGLIVDSEESLAEPNDIVRLQPLLQEPFKVIGLPVVTQMGRTVGKVDSYTINPELYHAQKLYVRQPIWTSLLGGEVIIDRSQIVDVSPTQITVKDTDIPTKQAAVNPLAKSAKTHPQSGSSASLKTSRIKLIEKPRRAK